MSDTFYDLLDNSNKYRCRKVDQVLRLTEQDGNTYDPDEILDAKKMILVSSLAHNPL